MRIGRRYLAGLVVLAAIGAATAVVVWRDDPADKTPVSKTPAEPVSSLGSDGVGDPYFPTYGNGGYDVSAYDIAIRYRIASQQLTGDTTISATSTQDLSQFNLDLALEATSVSVNGEPATFTQSDTELVVTPATPVSGGSEMRVRVRYRGEPAEALPGVLGGWFLTDDGAVAAGAPEIAAAWFPSNDHPADKALFTVRLTTSADKNVISNGRMTGRKVSGDLATTTWHESTPMATYLATVVIGDYRIQRGTTPGGIPYTYAISAHLGREREAALKSLRKTPGVVDFYVSNFGPYPQATSGGILANVDFGFSLENQTKPVYSKIFFRRGVNYEVIAHEIAHMWWGNSVSVAQWDDVWLNEGFATWSSWFYLDREVPGSPTLDETFERNYAEDHVWLRAIGDPGAENVFDPAVYTRGAMALHALSNRIGETDFTALLRTWASQGRDGNASVGEFMQLAEEVSGEDLEVFFQDWLFEVGRPLPSAELGFPESMIS